jgi:hypothetical protein
MGVCSSYSFYELLDAALVPKNSVDELVALDITATVEQCLHTGEMIWPISGEMIRLIIH